MARYRRYRRTIIRAPKKKWCSNMIPIDLNGSSVNQGTTENPQWTVAVGSTLAVNKTETSSPTPVVVKTGNYKLQADVYVRDIGDVADLTLVIIYIPEGVAPLGAVAIKDVMVKHPEWVIAWRKLDVEIASQGTVLYNSTARVTVSSRLKRNLNSGDSVNMYLFTAVGASDNTVARMRGMCQFWSCAN